MLLPYQLNLELLFFHHFQYSFRPNRSDLVFRFLKFEDIWYYKKKSEHKLHLSSAVNNRRRAASPSPACRSKSRRIGQNESNFSLNFCNMEDSSLLNKMMLKLRASCKYYTGFPKDLGPSRVIHFTSEREFVQILHQGHPVVVAFTIKCNPTKHLDRVLEEAAAEFYPHVKFMRVECPKYPGFCITRQKKEYPFIELFHSPQQAEGKAADPNITKYSVKVLPFNYDTSTYGFREFFKKYGVRSSDQK